MTRQEYENKIKELQDELEKLKAAKIADSGKRWKPEEGRCYWCVEEIDEVTESTWLNDKFDEWRYLTGNCFKTEEEAEEYTKQIEYTARYKNYIEEHSEPIDWKSRNQQKYNACYSTYDEEIYFENSAYACCQGVIYASSEQIIKAAIKEIGEDNFKKYVLGVK